MMVTEFAPYGVIGAITPTTNPTSTIINNSIAILSAGNSVAFVEHFTARMDVGRDRPVYKLLHVGVPHRPIVVDRDCIVTDQQTAAQRVS